MKKPMEVKPKIETFARIKVLGVGGSGTSAVNRMTDMTPFFFAAIIYLIMTFVLTVVAGRLEKHFSRYDAKEDW